MAVGIAAHSKRQVYADLLADQIDADAVHMDRSIVDPVGACARNHLAILTTLWGLAVHGNGNQDGWLAVLEDDAIPCEDFRAQLIAACSFAPVQVLGLFLQANPRGPLHEPVSLAIRDAQTRNAPFIVGDCLLTTIGWAVRANLAPSLITECQDGPGELPMRISRWSQRHHLAVAHTYPSLVDHRDGPSLIRGSRSSIPRKADTFGPRRVWSGLIAPMGRCKGWSAT